MSKTPETTDGKAVPFRRLSRVAGLGGMAAKIAGGMAVNGAKQFASGARPSLTDLMMTPANARKVTAQLSNMRGAAMKIGQMISMDSGDILQYPGVRESIDSDVNNVAGLLKLTYFPELSTDRVLAMSYIESLPIESLLSAPQETRNRVVRLLIELLLKELFEFGAMQTDPNFANYRYNNRAQKLVLLDFGASREVSKEIAFSYKQIMRAALSGDIYASFDAAAHIGFISGDMPERFKSAILDIIDTALEPLGVDADFDFGENLLAAKMRDKAMRLAGERELWHLPPPETVFIQRKIGGMYMLATRLRAQVNVRALMTKYVCGE